MTRTISEALAKAYLDAIYVVRGENADIAIQVGKPSADLAALMKKHGVNTAAFLTAFNPHSVPSTTAENIGNQNSLLADLQTLGLESISGEGMDPSHHWPSEPSVLALGIALDDAERLADRYQQNAFLWVASEDGFVELNLRHPIERPCA